MTHPRAPGSVEVICGPMFAGKTCELIRRLDRCRYARQPILVFKPELDTRYEGRHSIVSHQQVRVPAIPIGAGTPEALLGHVLREHPVVVGIDEAQFFSPELSDICERLASAHGIRVIVAGLDLDFMGRPFGPMPVLMALADGGVTKVTAICECGNLATRSQRLSQTTEQVEIGGEETYVPRCRFCWRPGA